MDRGSYTVQEAVIKTIPKKKKCAKAKWLSEEALQIAMNRRKAKGKGGKKRYSQLNAKFKRIARKDKKAFRSEQISNYTISKSWGCGVKPDDYS